MLNGNPGEGFKPILRRSGPMGGGMPKAPGLSGGGMGRAISIMSMHEGGTVPGEPGTERIVKLEAGEKVTPAKEEKKEEKKPKAKDKLLKAAATSDEPKKKPNAERKHGGKAKFRETRIEHHDNGSHTVRHVPHAQPGENVPEKSYAAPDLDAVHNGLDENLGQGEMPAGGEEPQPQAME